MQGNKKLTQTGFRPVGRKFFSLLFFVMISIALWGYEINPALCQMLWFRSDENFHLAFFMHKFLCFHVSYELFFEGDCLINDNPNPPAMLGRME